MKLKNATLKEEIAIEEEKAEKISEEVLLLRDIKDLLQNQN